MCNPFRTGRVPAIVVSRTARLNCHPERLLVKDLLLFLSEQTLWSATAKLSLRAAPAAAPIDTLRNDSVRVSIGVLAIGKAVAAATALQKRLRRKRACA
jgi:hypothetical protein